MPTLKYTTTVPVGRTVAEIQELLAKHGANAVATRYSDGKPSGLSFVLATPHGERGFTLPVDVDAVHQLLIRQSKGKQISRTYASHEHAERVAWRVLKSWLEAQLAIIEAQMATFDQVMLPYLHVDESSRTLYEVYREREQGALEIGGSS